MVESDYQWTLEERSAREGDKRNALSRAVPLEYAGAPQNAFGRPLVAYQGRVRPLTRAWRDSGGDRPRLPLTALGYGTETYAAAYPHCRNVFGFCDPVFDAVTAPDGLEPRHRYLSYLVIGWYSDMRQDPITLVTKAAQEQADARLKTGGPKDRGDLLSEALADEIKADYRWSYTWLYRSLLRGGPVQTKQPVRTLFVGQVTGVEWRPDHARVTSNAERVTVAVGTTSAEAMSALLASRESSETAVAVETLLNDIQFDLLREYTTASGQANLADMLHGRDFAPVPAGHAGATESGRVWIVKRPGSEERPEQRPTEADDLIEAARHVGAALPGDVARGLNSLNRAQAARDDLAAAVATRRGQVFADWTTYLAAKTDDAREYIRKEIEALDRLAKDLEAKEAARHEAKTELEGLLRRPGLPAYELDWVTAPRYYQPNDPVIVLSGLDPSTRYGGDGRLDPDKAGNLICRVSDEITTPGELRDVDPGQRSRIVNAGGRGEWDGIIPTGLLHREDLIALCGEACLLNPWLGKFLGNTDLIRYQNNYIAGQTANFKGVAPSGSGSPSIHLPGYP